MAQVVAATLVPPAPSLGVLVARHRPWCARRWSRRPASSTCRSVSCSVSEWGWSCPHDSSRTDGSSARSPSARWRQWWTFAWRPWWSGRARRQTSRAIGAPTITSDGAPWRGAVAVGLLAGGLVLWVGGNDPTVQWFGHVVTHGERSERRVALTFDDGPDDPFRVRGSLAAKARSLRLRGLMDVGRRYTASELTLSTGRRPDARLHDLPCPPRRDGVLTGSDMPTITRANRDRRRRQSSTSPIAWSRICARFAFAGEERGVVTEGHPHSDLRRPRPRRRRHRHRKGDRQGEQHPHSMSRGRDPGEEAPRSPEAVFLVVPALLFRSSCSWSSSVCGTTRRTSPGPPPRRVPGPLAPRPRPPTPDALAPKASLTRPVAE